MREKLLSLMKNEGLTPSRLAELLGIQPSGISHILAGRNKPSFDLMQKILRRFPRIDPDWLLLDKESMYRDSASGIVATTDAQPSSLFANHDESSENKSSEKSDDGPYASSGGSDARIGSSAAYSASMPNVAAVNPKKQVRRVIVLFEDHTFESYDTTE